ncbi:MAG: hypothetical protein K2P66_01555 [Lachnospiraceae bacterium]|nr:hypothetical protein [Lachnospiraceae bacterium]
MKREQMDTLNNLLLKARKEINTKNVKYDKNGIPCSVALDTSLHSQIKKFLLQYGPSFLYRYRPGNNWDIDNLKKDTIWLSTLNVLVNKNWTQILNFFYSKDCFLCNAIDFLIHPCLAGWSISGIPRL